MLEEHLGHHASPRDNVCFYTLPQLLLMTNDRLQQTVKVIIYGVIKFLEGVKALRQISSDGWCVVISKGRIVQSELMLVIV